MARAGYYDSATVVEVLRDLKADYEMGQTSRFRRRPRGLAPMGSGADWHNRRQTNWLRMIEEAREFDRNDVVVGQGISRVISNVYQDGFTPDPQTGNDDADALLTERWKQWSSDPAQCDVSGERDFPALARLVLRAVIVDGDVFPVWMKDGSLQHVEAHLCRTPTNALRPTKKPRSVVQGVLLEENTRRHLEYWFANEGLDPNRALVKIGDVRRVPVHDNKGRRQAWHVALERRFSQTRGVSLLAAAVNPVSMHGDLQFAKLVQAQVASCYAIIHERDAESIGAEPAKLGSREEVAQGDGSTRIEEELSPGMRIIGAPGERIEGFSPNVPNLEFFPHAALILTFVAINLGLPLAVLLLDPSKTNFSGWRGAMDQARMGFRDLQRWLINRYHRPVYLWKVAEWLDETGSELAALAGEKGVNIRAHRWNPPSWPYIEPNKDANADALRLNNRLMSLRRIHRERGRDWDEVSREIVEDNTAHARRAVEEAKKLNQEHPEAQIDWRELAAMSTGKKNSASRSRK